MMKSIFSPKQRLFSAVLCLSLVITAFPVLAAGMSVQLQISDPSAVLPVGTEITVRVEGTNTAAESLMIVDPDSRQQFLFGPEHKVKLTQPGMYILAGYGANGTDETAPGFQRCMSAFHMVTVEGNAAQGMEGSLSIEVYHNRQWQPLQNVRIRKPELLLRFTYSGQPLPEDAMLHSNVSWGINTVSLLEGTVANDTQWTYEAADTALSLVEPYPYKQYDMTVNADITLPDGQSVFACADFSMGHYSPEMLYVNEFFDENWHYGKSEMGQRLMKWLDMSPRTENRNNSGYLMLEEEIEFREDGLRKACESFVHWTSDVLGAISSLGVDILIKEWSDHEAQKKFGPEGTKALKYYNMLGSVYNSYAQTLANELQSVARGAYLEEEIQKGINFIHRGIDITDTALDALDLRNAEPDENLIYLFSPLNAETSYMVLGNMENVSGTIHNITLTSVEQLVAPDGSLSISYQWIDAAGKADQGTADTFKYFLDQGDRFNINTSRITALGAPPSQFKNTVMSDLNTAYNKNTAHFLDANGKLVPVISSNSIQIETGLDGKRKLIVDGKTMDFDAEKIQQLGIADTLSPEDQECLLKYSRKSEWTDKLGTVLDIAGLGLDVYQLHASRKQQSALQEAYFNVYKEVSSEYIHALYSWYKKLEGSKTADAKAIRAAIMALMNDIYDSCEESLSKAAQLEIVSIQTSKERAALLFDVCSFVCDIPAVKEGLANFGKSIVGAIGSRLSWVKNAVSTAKTVKTAETAASAATAAGSAAKLVSKLNAAMIGIQIASLVMDILLSAHFDYIDSIYTVYNTKKALNESLKKMLYEYGSDPTHQKAIDIIESLYLMKELKLRGENMIVSAYLSELYEDAGLTTPNMQLVLMNEILHMDHQHTLNGSENMLSNPVTAVYTNCYLGTLESVKEQGYEVKGDNWLTNKGRPVIGSLIEQLYRHHQEPLSFQGVELEMVNTTVSKITNTSNEQAYDFHYDNPLWAEVTIRMSPSWPNSTISSDSVDRYFKNTLYLYNNHGLELLLTFSEVLEYTNRSESYVNRILEENNDATGDDLAFWQIQAKKEWQWEQRIVWTYVTRKYIESLPMFDRTQN